MQGVIIMKEQFPVINGFLDACPETAGDVATIDSWLEYWGNQTEK